MKILITGGAGFIGFHLAKALLERGDQVIVIDNFNAYYDPAIKRDRIQQIENQKNFKFFKVDITNYLNLELIFKKFKFDKVCNLAAQAGVRYSLKDPHSYIDSNITGFMNILELCRHHEVNDIVYASSSSVYGANKILPFQESQKIAKPLSIYAATKKANEDMAYTYNHLFDLNCTGLRFFTVYGPWGRPDMALFLFTKAILDGKSINVFNNGNMMRDFTYIDDIVSGTIAALDNPLGCEVFNLGCGSTIKLMEFITEIERNLRLTAKRNYLPMQPGDAPATSADISKAKKMLGYNPKINVESGIKKFVDWYKKYYKK